MNSLSLSNTLDEIEASALYELDSLKSETELENWRLAYLGRRGSLTGKIEIIGIQEGVENSNYKIITDKDHFILTIYEKRVRENDLPYFIN